MKCLQRSPQDSLSKSLDTLKKHCHFSADTSGLDYKIMEHKHKKKYLRHSVNILLFGLLRQYENEGFNEK